MSSPNLPVRPAIHQCPSCHQPQTKIKRVLGDGKFGSSNFVCSRSDCVLAIDLSKVETWVLAEPSTPPWAGAVVHGNEGR